MNNEWLMIASMGVSGVCFAIGGTGFKWVRRYLMPILLAIIACIAGFAWYKGIGYAVGLMIALCLPYGDRTPWWLKAVVMFTYVLPSLLFGYTLWQFLSPLISLLFFRLSNLPATERYFPWKIVEFLISVLSIGVVLASLISCGGSCFG